MALPFMKTRKRREIFAPAVPLLCEAQRCASPIGLSRGASLGYAGTCESCIRAQWRRGSAKGADRWDERAKNLSADRRGDNTRLAEALGDVRALMERTPC